MLYKVDPGSSWTRTRPGPLEKANAGLLEKLDTKFIVWVEILFILLEDADFKYENSFLKFSSTNSQKVVLVPKSGIFVLARNFAIT